MDELMNMDLSARLKHLDDLLGGYSKLIGPTYHNQILYSFDCCCEFETYSYENWDRVWNLTCYTERGHWMNTSKKFLPCNEGTVEEFNAKTMEEVVEKAIAHFTLLRQQQSVTKEIQNGKN